MLDNFKELRKRLGKLGLGIHREEEIFREFSEHLEDHAAAIAATGINKNAAAREALDSVPNWSQLRKEILAAESEELTMNYRTKALWLPALVAVTLSSISLALLIFTGLYPYIYLLRDGLFIPFYVPWLLALPIIGAVAAFWSQRAGGKVAHRLFVSLAPPIISLGIMLIIFLPLSLAVDRHVPIGLKLEGLLTYIVAWVLVPSLALFLGAAPFLRKPLAQS